MKWIAMFSQTGSEIVTISRELGRVPDLIITNNSKSETWNPELEALGAPIMVSTHALICDYLIELKERRLVTLHGYMRILPPDVVVCHDIINGHPGDIIKYPCLKGKDPQAKAIEMGLRDTGVVLHTVTAGVDEGPVLSYVSVAIPENSDTPQLINVLKLVQASMWVTLLKEKAI